MYIERSSWVAWVECSSVLSPSIWPWVVFNSNIRLVIFASIIHRCTAIYIFTISTNLTKHGLWEWRFLITQPNLLFINCVQWISQLSSTPFLTMVVKCFTLQCPAMAFGRLVGWSLVTPWHQMMPFLYPLLFIFCIASVMRWYEMDVRCLASSIWWSRLRIRLKLSL